MLPVIQLGKGGGTCKQRQGKSQTRHCILQASQVSQCLLVEDLRRKHNSSLKWTNLQFLGLQQGISEPTKAYCSLTTDRSNQSQPFHPIDTVHSKTFTEEQLLFLFLPVFLIPLPLRFPQAQLGHLDALASQWGRAPGRFC